MTVRSWFASASWSASRCRTTVVLRPVPSHTEYHYAVVNERRVIVEPRTRRVVKIID